MTGPSSERTARRRYRNGVMVEVLYLVHGKWVRPMDLLPWRIRRTLNSRQPDAVKAARKGGSNVR